MTTTVEDVGKIMPTGSFMPTIPTRDVFLEKHWRSVVPRSVCDYYLKAQQASPDDVPPLLEAPRLHLSGLVSSWGNLISIQRGGVALVAVCMQEVASLSVIEFLHRVVDTFQDYFSDCTETIIKENYEVVYELLDEMLDNGFPLATESNIKKKLIKSPNTIANTVTGKSNVSSILPSGQLSNVPWRRSGLKYANNETYFDVVEDVDAIMNGNVTVSAEIQGYIDCCMKLIGMPDLTLNFVNPPIFDDVSFHPCVRSKNWESERILSFIPPDGNFRLMSYHIGSQSVVAIPLFVFKRSMIGVDNELLRFDLTVGPKQTNGRTLENVALEICMPKCALKWYTQAVTKGKYSFNPVSKVLLWDIGRIERMEERPKIRVKVLKAVGCDISSASIKVHFTIPQLALSGLSVSRLDMPFKGVKHVTKFHVRV